MRSNRVCASPTGWPSIDSTRSPWRRPAAAAGPPVLISPITGSRQAAPRPMRRSVAASASRESSRARSRRARRLPCPLRSLSISSIASPSITACATRQRRSVSEDTSSQSLPSRETERTQSPARSPAPSARLPAAGVPSTALGSSTPIQCEAAYSSTASSRFAAGPAATMAARWRKGLRLKAIDCSPGATAPSRSSSMRT